MLESNLHGGAQPIGSDRSELVYGVSITDPCIAWETTENTLRKANRKLIEARAIVNGSVGGNVESAQMANDVVSFELPSAGLNTTES